MRYMTALLAASATAVLIAGRHRSVELAFRPPPRGSTVLAVSAFASASLLALGAGLSATPAVAAGAIGSIAPAATRRRSAERRRRLTARRWPDFLAAVRSRLATGAALPAACAAAGRHVGGRFTAFDRPAASSFGESLERLRNAWADPLADRVLTTLALASRVGGAHVGAVLGALSQSVGDDLRLRRAHDAALTEQRLTAGVALLAPWVILALSIVTNPTSAEAFATPTGNLIVIGGLGATVFGYWMARRSARLAEPRRLFA